MARCMFNLTCVLNNQLWSNMPHGACKHEWNFGVWRSRFLTINDNKTQFADDWHQKISLNLHSP